MKQFIFYWLLLLPIISWGQQETLYYFTGKDTTTIGVKTASGRIILPPAYHAFRYSGGEKVDDRQILMYDTTRHPRDSMKFSYSMKVFDRNGKFLYCPFENDNGIDDYKEGLRRYVEHGKMGFVDYNGEKAIPAKFNYVDPFYRGYAAACLDCVYKRVRDDAEHCCGYVGTKYAIIDRSGTIVYHSDSFLLFRDSLLTALKLIQPYSRKDNLLMQSLKKTTNYRHFAYLHQYITSGDIIARPKNGKGFYMVTFRELDYAWGGNLVFLVSNDRKTVYVVDDSGDINWVVLPE